MDKPSCFTSPEEKIEKCLSHMIRFGLGQPPARVLLNIAALQILLATTKDPKAGTRVLKGNRLSGYSIPFSKIRSHEQISSLLNRKGKLLNEEQKKMADLFLPLLKDVE